MTHEALNAARGMRELVIEHRGETEESRELAPPIVDALIRTKLCRIWLPESEGGLGLTPMEGFDVYEELAAAEASVAWVAWNNALVCHFARFMQSDVRRAVFGEPRNLFASSTRPSGRAVPDGGSYRVNGRWSLVSGCLHAQWMPVLCLVEKDGEIDMLAPGVPHARMVLASREDYEIVDTWYVGGLRGTGSHDAVLVDAVVPSEHTFEPFGGEVLIDSRLARTPIAATMSGGCASICLGIARAALDALEDLARSKVSPGPEPDLRDHARTQTTAARSRALVNALRANVAECHAALWEELATGGAPSHARIADAWSASITAATESRRVLNDVYDVSGTVSLYTDSPIERAHRDVHAVLKHVVVQPFWLEEAGRVRLGLEPRNRLFAL